MNLELVTHCYRYSTLLRYQLSSVVLHPPANLSLTVTVFYTKTDVATTAALNFFSDNRPTNVDWNWQELPRSELCNRGIGRNRAALASKADLIWFTDADYVFHENCWQYFESPRLTDAGFFFPRTIMKNRTHELGDLTIIRGKRTQGLIQIDPSEFEHSRIRRAIGGVQIVSGEYCRSNGYLRNSARAQEPYEGEGFKQCREDVWFRRSYGSPISSVEIEDVFRIRHSSCGREESNLDL